MPAPGGVRELADLAAELNAIQLDRTRPLWEMWFIEGLEGGRVATLTKVHHAAIDGASGSEITVALFDLTPEVAEHPPPDEPWEPDKVPSELEMLGYAVRVAGPPAGAGAAGPAAHRAGRARRALPEPAARPPASRPLPFTAPSHLDQRRHHPGAGPSPSRRVSLTDVKRVKNAFGATVNDVVLALCAGALRRYFDERGEEVDGPLLAMVPVSVRPEEARADMGNQVSSIFTSLATDVDDPVERLLAIHEGMKRRQGAAPGHRRRDAHQLGRVRGARRVRPGHAALRPDGPGRPPPSGVQPHHLQRAGPAVPAVLGRRQARGQLPARARSSTARR